MSGYAEKLDSYLKKDPIKYVDGNSLLEQLYWCYTESNAIDSPAMREQYKKVYNSMPVLSEEELDAVFTQISKLLVMDETLAFQAGVKVGLRLTMELLE